MGNQWVFGSGLLLSRYLAERSGGGGWSFGYGGLGMPSVSVGSVVGPVFGMILVSTLVLFRHRFLLVLE